MFRDVIRYISLLVPDRQLDRNQYGTMELPRSVKDFLILECCNFDRSPISPNLNPNNFEIYMSVGTHLGHNNLKG